MRRRAPPRRTISRPRRVSRSTASRSTASPNSRRTASSPRRSRGARPCRARDCGHLRGAPARGLAELATGGTSVAHQLAVSTARALVQVDRVNEAAGRGRSRDQPPLRSARDPGAASRSPRCYQRRFPIPPPVDQFICTDAQSRESYCMIGPAVECDAWQAGHSSTSQGVVKRVNSWRARDIMSCQVIVRRDLILSGRFAQRFGRVGLKNRRWCAPMVRPIADRSGTCFARRRRWWTTPKKTSAVHLKNSEIVSKATNPRRESRRRMDSVWGWGNPAYAVRMMRRLKHRALMVCPHGCAVLSPVFWWARSLWPYPLRM